MFKNYLKTSIRNLWRNKGFSAINIIGLAIGLATCLLIFLYVLDELSYDKYNTLGSRIFRVNQDINIGGRQFKIAQTPPGMGPEPKREFAEVEQYLRFRYHSPLLVKYGDGNIRETKVVYADSTLFSVFTLPMIAGNPSTALKSPQSIVITESMAHKYFTKANPIGQALLINNKNNYTVTGVIKDIPTQSHFNFDFFIPMCENEDSRQEADGWLSENYNTYLLLKEGVNPHKLEVKLDEMSDRLVAPILKSVTNISMDEFKKQGGYIYNSLTPVTDIHLHSNREYELSANGSITYVYIFSAIAIFILLIACVNFMNLSTARSANRAREVGVRKVLGSLQKNLIRQFLVESLLLSFIAMAVALILAIFLLPLFNTVSGKTIPTSFLFQPVMLISLIALVVVTGFLAGSYPAFYLSRFKPVEVLKGKLSRGFKGSILRNSLVVFQFAVSIILITGTIIIYRQLTYIQNKDLGFDRTHVAIIQNTNALPSAKTFKDELQNISGISSVTMTGYLPVEGDRSSDAFFTDATLNLKNSIIMQKWTVDENYLSTLGIQLASGRNFSRDLASDSNAIIINESAARLLGADGTLGKTLFRIKEISTKEVATHHIVGIIKDFNFSSLRDIITPLVLRFGRDNDNIVVSIQSTNVANVLEQMKNKWNAMQTSIPFEYSFMDEQFERLYANDQKTGKIFIIFASLAIIIACLGLFGLAAYAAEQRIKEIGIRKVLGASTSNIMGMLSKDFLKLVIIASTLAIPVAWWAMHKWLQDFAYRVSIGWWIFLVAGALAFLIAILTVSYQALKAAIANPVDSLRNE